MRETESTEQLRDISSQPIRGALAGFGRMGLTHFAILNTHPDVRFVGICDSSSFMRKSIDKHISVETFEDYRNMLEKTQPDFLIVATPTREHAEITEYALERGLHVFVEKPFALNPQEGEQLVAMLRRRDLVNQVGYVLRFNDVMLQVRRLLTMGAIGAPVHFKVEMYGPTVLREAKGWRARKDHGGGCLYDFASHAIDLASYLLGVPSAVKGTVMRRIYSRGVEDAIYTTFLYPKELTGTIAVNWSDPSYRKPTYRVEVLGREGKIVADLHAYKIFFKGPAPVEGYNRGWNTRYVTDFFKPERFYLRGYEFTRQLDEFVACIRDRSRANLCRFEDALQTDRVIDLIMQDAGTDRVVNG